MPLRHLENINSSRAGLTSVGAAFTGEVSTLLNLTNLEMVNTAFQHLAWIIAIIAGLVSIINGTRKWFIKK